MRTLIQVTLIILALAGTFILTIDFCQANFDEERALFYKQLNQERKYNDSLRAANRELRELLVTVAKLDNDQLDTLRRNIEKAEQAQQQRDNRKALDISERLQPLEYYE